MTNTTVDTSREDTLLALALAFSRNDDADPEHEESSTPSHSPIESLRGLNRKDIAAVEERWRVIEGWTEEDKLSFAASTLARVRAQSTGEHLRLDENVHPSRIALLLRQEPPRIQRLVLSHLPSHISESVAETLGINSEDPPSLKDRDGSDDLLPDPRIIAIARRCFLSAFVSQDQLIDPTPLDLLSVIDLARLIRLLGIRQIAIACRGIPAVETVAAFLRRFSAEDSPAIAMQMLAMKDVAPQWIELAERLVKRNIDRGVDGALLPENVGLSVLAIALSKSDEKRRSYTDQKLPVAAMEFLKECWGEPDLCPVPWMESAIRRDVEAIGDRLHECLVALEEPGAGEVEVTGQSHTDDVEAFDESEPDH